VASTRPLVLVRTAVLVLVLIPPISRVETLTSSSLEPTGDTIVLGNTAKQVSAREFAWTAFVMGPDDVLDQVKCVEYVLHPTFPDPTPSVCARGAVPGKGFLLKATGWGTFKLGARVLTKSGRSFYLTHQLHFSVDAAGAWPVPPGFTNGVVDVPVTSADPSDGDFTFALSLTKSAQRLQVRVDSITLRSAGPRGGASWEFDITANGQQALHISSRSYSLSGKRPRSVSVGLSGGTTLPDGPAIIEIEGRH
jgi:hypothetical protein